MKKSLRLEIWTAVLTLILCSCSASQHTVKLSYEPQLTSNCVMRDRNVFILVNDKREVDSHVIGQAATGAFNETVPARSEISLQQFFLNSFIALTETLGGSIANSLDKADFVVKVDIMKFVVNEYAPGTTLEYAEAFVELSIAVFDSHNKTLLWQSDKWRQVKTPQNLMDATSELPKVANQAIADVINDFMRDPGLCNALTSPLIGGNKDRQPVESSKSDSPEKRRYEEDELILD